MRNNHHEYEQVYDDDADPESIELVQGTRSPNRSLGPPPSEDGTSSSSSSWTKWIVIFLLMIGMYALGMEDGKSKVTLHEGNEKNKDTETPPQNSSNDDDAENNNSFGTKFTIERVQNTRQAAQELITMLQEYYGGEEQAKRMMLQSWIQPWDFQLDQITGTKEGKLVDTMARALVTDDQEEFIIGTIGSSVAAGHDNCNYDSYERQMERTFGPVWEAAGMKLTCQNAGEGGGCGDDYSNQVYCIQQNVSPNIDIAHCKFNYRIMFLFSSFSFLFPLKLKSSHRLLPRYMDLL